MRRPDNMRRGPVSFTLAPSAFQRTDGPIKGPAPFPVQPDVMIITGAPFARSDAPKWPCPGERSGPCPAPRPPSDRVGLDEIHNSLQDEPEPYTEPS